MTNKFDVLIESMIAEMMPASMMDDFGPGEMEKAVNKKIEELPGKSQHWGPLQKLTAGDRERIIRAIIKNVFTEKGNTYTPMADDKDQLKELIKSAITKVTSTNSEFKAGGKWAVQFLADRLANEELLGKVKYTTEGGQEIKKDVTQKEIKAALNKALKETPTHSSWKKSAPAEEPEIETAPEAEEPEIAQEPQAEMETVYFKVDGFSSDDENAQAAYDKIPDSKDMSWEEVIKAIGTSKALNLLKVGGLGEEEREVEAGEDKYVSALDAEEDEAPDLSRFDKLINPYYSDTRGSFDRFNGDY